MSFRQKRTHAITLAVKPTTSRGTRANKMKTLKALKYARVNKLGVGMELKARYEKGVFRPLGKIKGVRKGEVVRITVKKKSLKDLGFVGMWKKRGDIKDGISYTKRIREWKRE